MRSRDCLSNTVTRVQRRKEPALTHDPEATERVRILLSGRPDVVEKKMVGGLSFLVNGNMCCGVTGTALMIRVGREGRDQALREPHARPMVLGGRSLSAFICVDPPGYAADDALARWVQRGLDFVAGLPAR
jgi:TfoX/Sxy family transcriptional regulator of competence genes